jgi:drug/metabolite transporter (DMT)-like permease
MSTWILLAILAQLIYAVVSLVEKYIVTSKRILHPFSYAFFVSILSALTVLVFFFGWIKLPFDFDIPSFVNLEKISLEVFLLSYLVGIFMFVALVNLFEAFSKADTSDVVPVVTSIGAIGTLILEYLFLDEIYNFQNLVGIFFLILGTFLVSRYRFKKEVLSHTLISGVAFACYYAFIKHIFNLINFDSGFLYTRLGVVLAALSIILIPQYRKRIFRRLQNKKVSVSRATKVVVGLKTLSGIGSIMILKAVYLGSVAVVQALSGVQFLFLILFSVFFGKKTHIYFGENDINFKVIIQKIIAVLIITTGLFFTFL